MGLNLTELIQLSRVNGIQMLLINVGAILKGGATSSPFPGRLDYTGTLQLVELHSVRLVVQD